MKNVPSSRRKQHRTLINEIRAKRGKELGDRFETFWMLRKRADYDAPESFQGDLDKVRLSAREDLVRMEAEFSSYASEI